jgi:hypothetical protein
MQLSSSTTRACVWVQGSGLRVWDLGFRVWGSGCRVQGAGCRVQGLGFRGYGVEDVDIYRASSNGIITLPNLQPLYLKPRTQTPNPEPQTAPRPHPKTRMHQPKAPKRRNEKVHNFITC